MTVPVVRFSQVVELMLPPGFIGNKTGFLFDDWRLEDLRLGEGRLFNL